MIKSCKICKLEFDSIRKDTVCCSDVCKKESRRLSFVNYNIKHKDRRAKARKKKYIPHPKIKLTKEELLERRRLTYPKYREKAKILNKKYTDKNKLQLKDKLLKKRYGLSLLDFEYKKNQQNNKCAICFNLEPTKLKNGNVKELAVDHCHSTNKIRDLLCSNCNTALGKVKDSIEVLENMIQYLKKHKELNEKATLGT